MTFCEPRADDVIPADLHELVTFDFASAVTGAVKSTVFLNVFDLTSALSIPNAMLCNTMFNTIGAFHAAVEVYGEEWSFYRTPNELACGVCKSLRPRDHPVHVYRKSIDLGATLLKDWEVRYLIRSKLAAKWPGGNYDLLQSNCIHFCEELLLHLGVMPVPAWVRGLHETGASVLKIPATMGLTGGDGEPEGGGNPKPKPMLQDAGDNDSFFDSEEEQDEDAVGERVAGSDDDTFAEQEIEDAQRAKVKAMSWIWLRQPGLRRGLAPGPIDWALLPYLGDHWRELPLSS